MALIQSSFWKKPPGAAALAADPFVSLVLYRVAGPSPFPATSVMEGLWNTYANAVDVDHYVMIAETIGNNGPNACSADWEFAWAANTGHATQFYGSVVSPTTQVFGNVTSITVPALSLTVSPSAANTWPGDGTASAGATLPQVLFEGTAPSARITFDSGSYIIAYSFLYYDPTGSGYSTLYDLIASNISTASLVPIPNPLTGNVTGNDVFSVSGIIGDWVQDPPIYNGAFQTGIFMPIVYNSIEWTPSSTLQSTASDLGIVAASDIGWILTQNSGDGSPVPGSDYEVTSRGAYFTNGYQLQIRPGGMAAAGTFDWFAPNLDFVRGHFTLQAYNVADFQNFGNPIRVKATPYFIMTGGSDGGTIASATLLGSNILRATFPWVTNVDLGGGVTRSDFSAFSITLTAIAFPSNKVTWSLDGGVLPLGHTIYDTWPPITYTLTDTYMTMSGGSASLLSTDHSHDTDFWIPFLSVTAYDQLHPDEYFAESGGTAQAVVLDATFF